MTAQRVLPYPLTTLWAIATEYDGTTCIALPVNDLEAGYPYPARVRFELTEKDIDSYRRAADFLNINSVDLVCLQHEYGIFGGRAGSHILALLRELRMPIVTTFHTILHDPDPDQQRVLEEVAALSDRLVVMSERGREFLQKIYGVQPEKIDFIPHGIPDVPFMDPSFHKDLFGVEGKTVLLSFGLLSANKGIETVIAALPAILARHPNVVYIILGATHPHVVRNEGETYRLSLQWLAQEKGVEGQVIFYNRFVSLEELVEFIGAADIYITPYLNEAQITSGTLAYTLGAGKAVISTPYWYAEEMLAEERGALVPFHDPAALAEQVIDLLDNESKRHAMRKRAYLFGRAMVWPQVARRYMESFKRARAERRHFTPSGFAVKPLDKRPGELPPLKLDHLHLMTDDTGMLQHASFTIPNYREGYSIDDNARALIVSTHLGGTGQRRGIRTGFPLSRFHRVCLQYWRPGDFVTLWIISVIGWKKAAPMTAMAAPCGPWAPCWAALTRRPSRVWPAGFSNRPCLPFSRPPAPGPGPSPSSVFMSIYGDLKVTAGPTRFGMNWPGDCSPYIKTAVRMNGAGMRPG